MFLTHLDTLLSRIKNAEYAHLLLEPVPLFGLLFGLIFFAVGLWGSENKTRMMALVVIVLSCLSVVPYHSYRSISQPRVMNMISLKKSYKDQTDFRRTTHWVYYTMGALALLALVSSGKVGNLANYAVLLGGIATLIFSTWLHMTEAEIFHPNIRVTPVRTVPARYPQQQPPQAPPRTTPPTSVPSAPPPSAPSGVSLDRPPKEAQLPPPRSATRNSQAYVP